MEVDLEVYENTAMRESQPENLYTTLDNTCRIQRNSSATQTIRKSNKRFVKVTAFVLVSLILTALVLSLRKEVAFYDLPDDKEKKDLGSGHTQCCEKEWTEMMDHCYYFGEKNLTWEDSETECMGRNSHLVKIESIEENDMIVTKIKTSGKIVDKIVTEITTTSEKKTGNNMNYWIGLNDKHEENNFTWISDNSGTTFRNWGPGMSGIKVRGQHCAYLSREMAFQWKDIFCGSEQFFICERPVSSMVIKDRLDSIEKKIKALENDSYQDLNDEIEMKELRAGQIICEKEWTAIFDHCYYFGGMSLTWDESEAECMGMNSHLVKVESKEENDMITANIRTSGVSMSYWIGLNDKHNENNFTWISDNTITTFRDWAPGEPRYGGRHCVHLWKEKEYRWDDDFCSYEKFFICEKPEFFVVVQGRLDSLERKIKALENVLCGKDWILLFDHCYFLGGTKQTWTESEKTCREMNASLIHIKSKEEYEIIVHTIKLTEIRTAEVYIGLRRNVTGLIPTEFGWTDNSNVTFADWDNGQPSLTYQGQQEECVVIRPSRGYRWNDVSCYTKMAYICEKTTRQFV